MGSELGKELARLRKERKLTQKELCREICTQPTISMIEKGTIIPGIEILSDLAAKLGIPLNNLTQFLGGQNLEQKNRLINLLEELALKQDYKQIYEITLNEKTTDIWLNTYLKWLNILSQFHLQRIDIVHTINQLKKLLEDSPDKIIHRDLLSYRIVNSIGFLFSIKKEYSKAIFYYNKIQLSSEEKYEFNTQTYQLKFLYNKTKTLYDMGKYEEVIELANKSIEKCIVSENMAVIGNFYYYIALAHEKLNSSSQEIVTSFEKALFFFELLDRTVYKEIVQKKLESYSTL